MKKELLVAAGFILALAAVLIGLLLLDEQRYRSCIEAGGWPEGVQRPSSRTLEEAVGEASRQTCRRVAPF